MAEKESYYDYEPSVAAAGIFVAIFAILGVIHFYQTIRTRTWFCIPFGLGALRKYNLGTMSTILIIVSHFDRPHCATVP